MSLDRVVVKGVRIGRVASLMIPCEQEENSNSHNAGWGVVGRRGHWLKYRGSD